MNIVKETTEESRQVQSKLTARQKRESKIQRNSDKFAKRIAELKGRLENGEGNVLQRAIWAWRLGGVQNDYRRLNNLK